MSVVLHYCNNKDASKRKSILLNEWTNIIEVDYISMVELKSKHFYRKRKHKKIIIINPIIRD